MARAVSIVPKMSARTRDWLIAIGYVALIFGTLEIVRVPLSYLRSHGWLRHTISILFGGFAIFGLRALIKNHGRDFIRLLGFFLLLSVYYRISHSIRLPEEQLHFFEYGLVGIFFFRALYHQVISSDRLWISAWLISSLAGWCDELLQGITPTRHYDIRDVGMNAMAAALGLIVYFICKSPNRIE